MVDDYLKSVLDILINKSNLKCMVPALKYSIGTYRE